MPQDYEKPLDRSLLAFGRGANVYNHQQNFVLNETLQRSIASTKAMLAAKSAWNLQAILQLPHMPWADHIGPQRGFEPYTHQQAYILDQAGSPTRWTYGLSDHQPGFNRVKSIIDNSSGERNLAKDAMPLGIDGILIEKRAFEPAELLVMMNNVEADESRVCKIFDDQFRVLYAIGANLPNSSCRR